MPELTHRLIGREPGPDMTAAYARLCLPFCGAVCLNQGTGGLGDFSATALADADILALASRLSVIADSDPDPNALAPIRVKLDLADGRTVSCDVAQTLGSPARPLSREGALAKFIACAAPRALWDTVMALDAASDPYSIVSLL